MFRIDFDRSSMPELPEERAAVLDSASEMNLRYGYFRAKVNLAVEGFDDFFPGATVLDFMFCLLLTAGEVTRGEVGRVDFTENNLSIDFHPEGAVLTVLRSWDPTPGRCTIDEFLSAVRLFVEEGLEFIVWKYPVFAENETYRKLLAMTAELELPPRQD